MVGREDRPGIPCELMIGGVQPGAMSQQHAGRDRLVRVTRVPQLERKVGADVSIEIDETSLGELQHRRSIEGLLHRSVHIDAVNASCRGSWGSTDLVPGIRRGSPR